VTLPLPVGPVGWFPSDWASWWGAQPDPFRQSAPSLLYISHSELCTFVWTDRQTGHGRQLHTAASWVDKCLTTTLLMTT
jgi:hypothetical protein